MKRVRCPHCQKWSDYSGNAFRPFCSEPCKKRDLGDWASEKYKIPVMKREEEIEGKKPLIPPTAIEE